MKDTSEPFFETKKELDENEKFINFNEYKIKKDDSSIDILIGITEQYIVIRSLYYEVRINSNELSLLTKIIYNSLDEVFEYLNNLFKEKEVIIKNITKDRMTLILKINDYIRRKEKQIEIILMAQIKIGGFAIYNIINKYLELEQEIKLLKKDNKSIKEENAKLKEENSKLRETNFKIQNDIKDIKKDIDILKMNNNNNNNNYQNIMMNPNYNQNNNNMNQMKAMMDQINLRYSMEQMMNQMNENNFNQREKINVIFRSGSPDDNRMPYLMECFPDNKLSDIFEEYKKQTKNMDDGKFIYQARALNPKLTVSEAGLTNNANIFVVKNHSSK